MIECPLIPPVVDSSQDEHSAWEAKMVDFYLECALRHKTLIDWERENASS